MGDASSLGFGHFLQQSDIVARVLLVVLVLMSAISWYLIVYKGISQVIRQKRSQKFLTFFWNATSLEAVQNEINMHGVREPFGHLTAHALHAQAHHAKFGAAKLEEAGSEQEFLTRTIKKVLDEETTPLENGLTMLATIGATAPFVGLFGTVWGVYHALVAIGMSGSGTLDKVAGPVGEALIMTGIGLAVAIPAVMGYNWLTRSNRVLTAKLDAFAYELQTFLSMGRALQASGPRRQAGQRAARRRQLLAGENDHGLRKLRPQNRLPADGRDQHGAVDRRHAGAAGDLHRHRAAADPCRQARAAQGELARRHPEAREDRVRDRRQRRRCSGTASASAARTRRASSPRRAPSGRSPKSTCAPTRTWPTALSRETLADASKAGLSKVGFVSEPAR